MVVVTDTDFYIAVGVLSAVLFVTILVVCVLLVYVLSVHKHLKQQRQPGAFDKYDDYEKGRSQPQVRSTTDNNQLRFPVPNMYGEDPAAQARTNANRNPLANQNNNSSNFERNSAVINEIRRDLKQANYRQAPTPPPKPEVVPSWPRNPVQQHQLRPPASDVHNMENKNFFY